MTTPRTDPATTAVAEPSPCVGVCRLDPAGRVCVGCGRTLDEIAAWPNAGSAERARIRAAARHRRPCP